ncbi:hypothetical protein AAZX31_13G319700 [Glycine max]|uniref:Transmembrane protein n=1 Tax=Glycine max TaxID=3847 RepID=I1M4Y7_SOYBN|nr:uncharacterized protein LOC100792546 [Glycine max]KAG4961375.1 hypothetical protein JHK87_038008 [Glycine soja]KAG4972385.1 hypothetical protein JHK85_038806 [Glycine max]KAG4978772.1 hypothetical protein JHK86_038246 [Glycine max]KAG5114786.1 hypothetical protein JHK82_038055 [Glycine max]KAG5132068.1 hypothetical protein JHK84_038465 [Glycine max]|eukprot:XP_003543522.1 uncharacterized protein LOC100792546 [Glycine max]
MATTFASSSPRIATFLSSSSSSSTLRTTTTLPSLQFTSPSKKLILFHNPVLQKHSRFRPLLLPPPPAAAAEDAVDAAEQLYKTTDQGVATVVSALFFIAFVGLSAITIGVVYLAVTDFLQKRETDKFEKEEAAKGKNKNKKKKKVGRARAGPRGFGQKVVEDDDD